MAAEEACATLNCEQDSDFYNSFDFSFSLTCYVDIAYMYWLLGGLSVLTHVFVSYISL